MISYYCFLTSMIVSGAMFYCYNRCCYDCCPFAVSTLIDVACYYYSTIALFNDGDDPIANFYGYIILCNNTLIFSLP